MILGHLSGDKIFCLSGPTSSNTSASPSSLYDGIVLLDLLTILMSNDEPFLECDGDDDALLEHEANLSITPRMQKQTEHFMMCHMPQF